LNADIAKEVEEGHQEKAQSGDRLLVTDSTITAGTFVVSDIPLKTIKAPSQQSAEKALGAESNPKVIDAAEVCDNTVGTKVGANGDVAAEESILEVPSQF
jgi:hypothetical protein